MPRHGQKRHKSRSNDTESQPRANQMRSESRANKKRSRQRPNKKRSGQQTTRIRPEQFRHHQIAPNHICMRCSKEQETKIMFCWTACNHWYCVECTFQIINESLSMMNEIPKCIHPKCNQSLNVLHAQSIPMEKRTALLPKYRVSGGNMHCVFYYNQADCLVAGYIRFGSNSRHFPVDVALMISDYFKLVYYTKIRCQHCRSRGYIYVDCTRCEAKGYTTHCDGCESTGTFTKSVECSKCKGSGDFVKDYPCRRCNGSGTLPQRTCRRCKGTGDYSCPKCGGTGDYDSDLECRACDGRGYVGECFKCEGTGKTKMVHCNNCNGTGIHRYEGVCNKCDGEKTITITGKCRKCKGTGSRRERCTECKSKKQVPSPCSQCEGQKVTMALDFNKLCNKQSLCIKCGLFHPNDMLIYWSGCNHLYCIDCIRGEITEQNCNQKRVPICISNKCSRSLSLERMNSIPGINPHGYCIGGNHYVEIASLKQWSGCHHFVCIECGRNHIHKNLNADKIPLCLADQCGSELVETTTRSFKCHYNDIRKLSILIYRKDKFQCSLCSQWRDNKTKIRGKGGRGFICKPCDVTREWCNDCRTYSHSTQCISWSMCGHTLCMKCAKLHVTRWVLKRDIPKCKKPGCSSMLSLTQLNSISGIKRHAECVGCSCFIEEESLHRWSHCNHLICSECVAPHVHRKIQERKIPLCMHRQCRSELTVDTMNAFELNKSVPCSLNWFDKVVLKSLIYQKDKFQCTKCKKWRHESIRVEWSSKCNHCYCIECALQIINESLSMMNEIPKCIYPKCNQSMDILPAHVLSMAREKNTGLLPKYQVSGSNMDSVFVYNQTDCLIAGYIRFGSNSHNFPVDVASMIFDHFKLVFYTKIRCQHCKSRGYNYVDCTHCEATGYYTMRNFRNIATGWTRCTECKGKKQTASICSQCKGNKATMAFDFHKLRKKQSLCIKCGLFHPNDMIIYWSGCNHCYCIDCGRSHIQRNIKANRIPLCAENQCGSELTVKTMSSFGLHQDALKTLIHRKGKFQCTKCSQWQHNSLEVEWSNKCGHKYCTYCIRNIMDDSIPRKKPVIGIFQASKIPRCVAVCEGTQCGEQLNLWISKNKAIGASEFQIKTLSDLIEGARNGKKEEKCLVM